MGRVFKNLINSYQNVFITGTDTDVGKTYFSAIMLSYTNGVYYKPVQTGVKDSQVIKSLTLLDDKHFIEEAYSFDEPISPHIAAENNNITIEMDKLLPPPIEAKLIVEGAGGVFTPLAKGLFMIDLIEKLRFPVVVVSTDKIGCINHTVLTVNALRGRGINVFFIVMNNYRPESYNLRAIKDILNLPVLGIPRFDSFPDKKKIEEIFNEQF